MDKTYTELRQEIVERNENLIGTILNSDEKIVDQKLKKMKKDFKESCNGSVPYNMPVLKDERIWNSELYHFLKELPKGSDLHVHGTSLIPTWKLIDFVLGREDLFIDVETCILHLESDKNEKCMLLKDAFYGGYLTRDILIKKWTVLGGEESEDIWLYFEKIFEFHDAIDRDMNILRDYYIFAFRDYLKCGIIHIEIHILLSESLDETLGILRAIKDAYYEVKKEKPEFVVSIIGSSMKMLDYTIETTSHIFMNVLEAQTLLKDEWDGNPYNFVLGFDLVNEEDKSRPLKDYAEFLISLKKDNPQFQYFLHCGESLDPRSDNLIDAYLIGATRVGHGTNLYRYPDLLKCYADKEICLESCLISNQTLRYVRDLRLHPSSEYLKRGVSVSLCSDDPAYQEHEQLTDDFFAATVCWDLGIADIKQLCINSITYSGIEQERKTQMLRYYRKCWNEFIQKNI